MMLGDFGAEILKIENPAGGDGARQWGPPWLETESAYFLGVNRNKKSLTLDLKQPEGQSIARKLALRADVVIENFMPGRTADWELDYETLASEKPGLIYCSITGYGQNGPYHQRPGYDFIIQAQGGLLSVTGPEEGPPSKVGVAIVDITAGLYAANAILAALYHRQQTGEGQYIDVALLDTQVAWLANVAQNHFISGKAPARYGNGHPNIVPYQIFDAADGYFALAVGTDSQFRRLCLAIQRDDLAEDARYKTNAGRVEARTTLIGELQSVFNEDKVGVWLKVMIEHGIPAGPVNDVPTILADPQIEAREMVQEIEHASLGSIKQLGPVPKLSRTPATIRMPPPRLGEHSSEVLREELEFSEDEIANLRSKAVIA